MCFGKGWESSLSWWYPLQNMEFNNIILGIYKQSFIGQRAGFPASHCCCRGKCWVTHTCTQGSCRPQQSSVAGSDNFGGFTEQSKRLHAYSWSVRQGEMRTLAGCVQRCNLVKSNLGEFTTLWSKVALSAVCASGQTRQGSRGSGENISVL